MKKIIMTTMLCLFAWTNIALSAENVIHYSNRPGNMLVKYNDVLLATIGNGKVKVTSAGEMMLETNTNTDGKIYLNDKRTGNNVLNVTSTYFARYNATLHILNDNSGITLVSVTLNGKPGFVHSIDVVKFVNTISENLEKGFNDATKALEAAIKDGADNATQEALEAAVAEATVQVVNFSNFISTAVYFDGGIQGGSELLNSNNVVNALAGDYEVSLDASFNDITSEAIETLDDALRAYWDNAHGTGVYTGVEGSFDVTIDDETTNVAVDTTN